MLSDRQVAVLEAAVNRIIPPDQFLGGWDGGVGSYLERQFEGDLRDKVEVYALGLDALNAEAVAILGKDFDELDTEAQDRVLIQIEQGIVKTDWPVDAAVFFRMMVDHSMEGYYSDPGNGGNQTTASWKMIGFEVTD